eukprot:jgi/Botrbrau1/5378/Bobra.0346s0041.3
MCNDRQHRWQSALSRCYVIRVAMVITTNILEAGSLGRALGHWQASPSRPTFDVQRRRNRRYSNSYVRTSRFSVVKAAESFTVDETLVANRALLDKFWRGKGIHDEWQRHCLIQMAEEQDTPGDTTWLSGKEFSSVQEVVQVSQRLIQLNTLLGNSSEVDVVWMTTKEPRLLQEDLGQLTLRLIMMRTSGGNADILQLLSNQPSLLLQDNIGVDESESTEQRVRAWSFGLVSDGDVEWVRHYIELEEYVSKHGDAHVGFRSGDDAELSRWAGKQRRDHKHKSLSVHRYEKLSEIGFEFDGEEAEWSRWFLTLQEATLREYDSTPGAGGDDIYLTNWCSVQRIAKRSKRLSEERVARLDSIGFDWTGADALS